MLPPALLAKLDEVWPLISAAPELFGLLVLGCLGASLVIMQLLYRRELKTKVAEIGLLAREKDAAERRLADGLADLARLKNGAGTAALGITMGSAAAPSTKAGRLDFVFGDVPPFSELAIDPEGRECRFVRVALLNTGDEHLDECQASIERMTPGPERAVGAPFYPLALTADSFSLRPGARKLLDIAFHHERHPDGTSAPKILIMSPRSVFTVTVPADKVQAMYLRSSTAEGVFTEATCRLFIEDGRLRLLRQ